MTLEVLVEEFSAKAFLESVLPRMVPEGVVIRVHAFNGKSDLLRKLPQRLAGYRYYGPDTRILVLVDRDDDDCAVLKQQLEKVVADAGFVTKAAAGSVGGFRVCTRVAIEELEAWFLGDQEAVLASYPGVRPYRDKAGYRNPDAVAGGTWEALERLLQRAGHYQAGLAKVDCAVKVAEHFVPARNRSGSFRVFADGVSALVQVSPA